MDSTMVFGTISEGSSPSRRAKCDVTKFLFELSQTLSFESFNKIKIKSYCKHKLNDKKFNYSKTLVWEMKYEKLQRLL